MKLHYFLPFLCILASCHKNEFQSEIRLESNEAYVSLSLSNTLQTKVAAASAANEKSIQNVQVYVFRNTGSAADNGTMDVALSKGFDTAINDATGTYTDNSLSFKCPTGPKSIYVVANDSEDRCSTITTEEQFLAQTHSLSNANENKILMIGKLSQELVTGEQNLTIAVERMAAAVVLNSITNDFDAAAYRGEDVFRLKQIYLYNVAAQINFAGDRLAAALNPEQWINKASLESDAGKLSLTRDIISDNAATVGIDERVINYGSAHKHSTPHTFYSYANECAFSEEETWNQRAAVLIVEAEIMQGGSYETYYYPIKITPTGGLEANKKYCVDLVIHRSGSTNPNKPVEFASCTPTITVRDWTTVELNDGNPFEI